MANCAVVNSITTYYHNGTTWTGLVPGATVPVGTGVYQLKAVFNIKCNNPCQGCTCNVCCGIAVSVGSNSLWTKQMFNAMCGGQTTDFSVFYNIPSSMRIPGNLLKIESYYCFATDCNSCGQGANNGAESYSLQM